MIGFKVLAKDGLKGPFLKKSVIKAITSAVIPLNARLLDLETGKYVSAAELVGEKSDRRAPPRMLREVDPDVTVPMQQDAGPALTLAENAAPGPAEAPRVFLTGKTPLLRNKQVRLPAPRNPRKLLESPEELNLDAPAA
ncbi:MAG: hypothetical protein HS108_16125 [Planctomycetes bacterium]|jgi:hypothetical protein|nr:hypothetical protein [Planctomycetota bacterium]MCL4730005.1 hypothetical protein [Planctomycetota bacterium]